MCVQEVSKTLSLHLPPKLFLAGQPLSSFRSGCVEQVSVRNSTLTAHSQHTHNILGATLHKRFKMQRGSSSNDWSPSIHHVHNVLTLRSPVVTICTASGHYMYRQFNMQQLYVLPIRCIYVFCVDLRTNSDYFPIQY
jgi:hypothetical protein